MPKKNCRKTFRRINDAVRSERLKASLLEELDGGQDAGSIVQMVEGVRPAPVQNPPVQAVMPMPTPAPAPQPCPVHGTVQPQPGPRPVPPPAADGSSRAGAVEVLDLDDEFIQDLRLSPRRERRLRQQIQTWRSSSSE